MHFKPGSSRCAVASAVLLALSAPVVANTVTVTQATDSHVPGLCSLREAIQTLNTAQPQADINCGPGEISPGTVLIRFPSITPTQGSLSPNGGHLIQGALNSGRTRIVRDSAAGAFPVDLAIQHHRQQIVPSRGLLANRILPIGTPVARVVREDDEQGETSRISQGIA